MTVGEATTAPRGPAAPRARCCGAGRTCSRTPANHPACGGPHPCPWWSNCICAMCLCAAAAAATLPAAAAVPAPLLPVLLPCRACPVSRTACASTAAVLLLPCPALPPNSMHQRHGCGLSRTTRIAPPPPPPRPASNAFKSAQACGVHQAGKTPNQLRFRIAGEAAEQQPN